MLIENYLTNRGYFLPSVYVDFAKVRFTSVVCSVKYTVIF